MGVKFINNFLIGKSVGLSIKNCNKQTCIYLTEFVKCKKWKLPVVLRLLSFEDLNGLDSLFIRHLAFCARCENLV